MKHNPVFGATDEMSLRVSVATLVRVIINHPTNDEVMLALERKATLHKGEVAVKSQPFGGAIRILDLDAVFDLLGDFRFDSERSRAEQDFRIFIRPSDWSVVREFSIEHINRADDLVLETGPDRELAEEFADALKINLKPDQYSHKPVATLVEDEPAQTKNIHAKDIPTVRVYRIHEACISDYSMAHIMMKNSKSVSHQDLCNLALEDARNGGEGRANAVLALPLKRITDNYLAITPEARNVPVIFENNRLDETVPAVLDGITVPKYQRL